MRTQQISVLYTTCITHATDRLAGDDSDFVGLCVWQTGVLLVGRMISMPPTTTILSLRVRPALGTMCPIYRTGTPLPSKHPILYIFSTNVHTELFKHAAHSPFFSLQNAVYFITLPFLVPVLFVLYILGVLKFKCQIPVSKG
jgi:hypothetical protein